MKLTIVVKPNSRQETVEKLEDGTLKVAVNAPPQEGRANEAVIRAIAQYLGVPKSRIRIVSGVRGKKKIVEVEP